MLYLLLSFDYELFLKRNYKSCDDILFEPTKKILKCFLDEGVKGTFFADVLSVYAHLKAKKIEYARKFETQLKDIVAQGSDVQLHIHSSWLTNENCDTMNLSSKNYRIQDYGFGEEQFSAKNILKNCKMYLDNLLKETNKNYSCIAFRAGGFCLQPNQEELANALLDCGIRYDSSIVPKMINRSSHFFNYSYYPKNKNLFLVKDNNRYLLEIPVVTYRKSLIHILLNGGSKCFKRKITEINGEFCNVKSNDGKIRRFIDRFFSYHTLNLDELKAEYVMYEIKKILNKTKNSDNVFLSIVCHPKLQDDCGVENIKRFINLSKQDNRIRFITFSEIDNLWRNQNND